MITKDQAESAETIVWLIAIICLEIGSGVIWGWAAALVVFGGVFTAWPMLKHFAAR